MADTATYAGAMRTQYPDSGPHVARKPGDSRPPKGSGGLTPRQRRSAARNKARRTQNARDVRPGSKANGLRPA